MHRVLARQLKKLGITEGPPDAEQWAALLERVDCAYVEADQDRYTLERSLDLSSAEMKKRFAELRTAQEKLVEASRKAGMADVATSVLHNVGNVLNSVNVSSGVVGDLLKGSSRAGLGKVLGLLAAQSQPGKFIDEDPKGKKVLTYLGAIDRALVEEREKMLQELESLTKAVDHIKVVVSTQLSVARGDRRGQMIEPVVLDEVAATASSMVDACGRAGMQIVRDCEAVVVHTDRHKLLEIVGNLLTNARDAVAARGDGTITVRTRRPANDAVAIDVSDDGIGIAPETLTRIFNHGFTTKPSGHGFGLHASACAALELGGTLTATSEGLGHGATFTLTLPLKQKRAA